MRLTYKQSSVNVLPGLQSSFRIVCDLFDKGFWGEREGICPMVFHDVVKECVFSITGYVH